MVVTPAKEFDVASFSDTARRDLLDVLERIPGKKTLVLSQPLVGPVDRLVRFSKLQEHGVDRVFFLENGNTDPAAGVKHVVFLASGEMGRGVHAVANQIQRLQSTAQTDHEYSVIWVPRRTQMADKILEEAGILGDVHSYQLPLYFQAIEDDVLSMESEDAFEDLYLHKDPTYIFLAAQAFSAMQHRYGLFPYLAGKGDRAKRLADLLMRMRTEVSADQVVAANGVPSTNMMPSASVESLIIIDREVDFASVLLTQLTYEGLIDDTFGIQHGQVELSSSLLGDSEPQGKPANIALQTQGLKRKVKLDASDKFYAGLRDVNFVMVGSMLNKTARRLQSDYETRVGLQKSVSELRDFVSKLPGYQAEQQSLKLHTSLTEEIMSQTTNSDTFGRCLDIQQNLVAGSDPDSVHDDIEELINRDAPLTTVLRLLCLESCVNGGLKQKDYDHFRSLILHAYGHQHLLTLTALQTMQLLEPRSASGIVSASLALLPGGVGANGTNSTSAAPTQQRTVYSFIRRPLHLIIDEISEQDPSDIAYVYSGYAPLSVRLVQCLVQKEYLSSLNSRTSRNSANTSSTSAPANNTPNTASSQPSPPSSDLAAGWRPFDDALRQIRGATLHTKQHTSHRAVKSRAVLSGHGLRRSPATAQSQNGSAGPTTTVLVFYLGGVTFAEIAAIRFINQRFHEKGESRRIVLCTTGLINGDEAVKTAIRTSSGGVRSA